MVFHAAGNHVLWRDNKVEMSEGQQLGAGWWGSADVGRGKWNLCLNRRHSDDGWLSGRAELNFRSVDVAGYSQRDIRNNWSLRAGSLSKQCPGSPRYPEQQTSGDVCDTPHMGVDGRVRRRDAPRRKNNLASIGLSCISLISSAAGPGVACGSTVGSNWQLSMWDRGSRSVSVALLLICCLMLT